MRIPLLAMVMGWTVVLGACAPMAHDLNRRNAADHWMAARQAASAGDWDTARRQYAQALVNVRLAHAGPGEEGSVSYEYGKVLGISCDYPQAEQMLQASLTLARQSDGPQELPLLELALLAEHRQRTQQALGYYRELAQRMSDPDFADAHPRGVADVLRRYAGLLAASGDAAGAAQQRASADALAAAHPDAREEGSLTAYGSACGKAS